MSHQRRAYISHVAGLMLLFGQLVAIGLKNFGRTSLDWPVVLLPTIIGTVYLAVSSATYLVLTAHERAQRRQWRRFDYDDKANTAPPEDEQVWVVEEYYYNGVTIGWFDGYTFRVTGYGDDCKVSWWAPIIYPDPPAQRERDRAKWERDESSEDVG